MHLWPVASLLSPSLTPIISHHPLHCTALQPHHCCRHPQPLSVGLYPVTTFALPFKAVCTDPSIRTDTCLEEEVL